MIEAIIRNYLLQKVDVPVYIAKPSRLPVSYVFIERTGGTIENQIRHATIAVQSIGGTMEQAAQLHEAVLEHMQDAIELQDVSAVYVNSEYNFTDTETKEFRYQGLFEITYY